jgi:hypothetical protein
MSMSTGTKVLIGCGIAFVVGGLAVAAAVFGGLFWIKGKADQFTGNEKRIEELKRKANAVPFTPPADRVIQEDRLVKFLGVRKRMFTVYEKHKDELDAMSKKKQADFSDLTTGVGVFNELRSTQAEALADAGMSEAEYAFLVQEIYKSMMGSAVAQESGGKSISQVAGETYDTAAESAAKARQAAEQADAQAQKGEGNLTPEQRKMLADSRDASKKMMEELQKNTGDLQKQAAAMRENAKALDAPPQNIALFRKYETEIRKYAMGGLEWMGL